MRMILGNASSGKTRKLVEKAVQYSKQGEHVTVISKDERAEYIVRKLHDAGAELPYLTVKSVVSSEELLTVIKERKTDSIYLIDGSGRWDVETLDTLAKLEESRSTRMYVTVQVKPEEEGLIEVDYDRVTYQLLFGKS